MGLVLGVTRGGGGGKVDTVTGQLQGCMCAGVWQGLEGQGAGAGAGVHVDWSRKALLTRTAVRVRLIRSVTARSTVCVPYLTSNTHACDTHQHILVCDAAG
jgi:hypothetical protein